MRATKLPPGSWGDEQVQAERFVDSLLPVDRVVRVLAAGAGGRFLVRPPAYVVAVETLQAEESPRTDADESRTLDLEQVELEKAAYDLILCCNVLEHAGRPLDVLQAFRDSLRPGGLIVIMVPNVVSLKGIVTRLTPFAFHRWCYSRVFGFSPDNYPSPSVHSFSLRPASFRRHAQRGGWKIEYWRVYEGGVQKSLRYRIGVVGRRWRFFVLLTRVLSVGFLTAEGTGIIAVLRNVVASETSG